MIRERAIGADNVEAVTEESSGDDAAVTDADPTSNDRMDVHTRLGRVWKSPSALAMITGMLFISAVTGLVCWLMIRTHQSNEQAAQRNLFLQVGQQSALNLTTIDWQNADSDVQRILSGATGDFYNEFASRSQPFIEVVKQAKSQSVGTVTAAGIESASPDAAQILVAVQVKTSNDGVPEQQPRAWRMRISVQKAGEQVKVSNVEFVP